MLPQRDAAWPFFDEQHRLFARELAQWANDAAIVDDERDADASVQAWAAALGAAGWLKPCVGTLDVRTLCIARETLAHRSALADFAFAMQGLGTGAISLFGTQDQRERYLPQAAAGTAIAAFALSERAAGSDVAALATRATRDGDAYVLEGEKTWISNAGIAASYVVFARTSDEGARGLTAFVVPADTPGRLRARTHRDDLSAPARIGAIRRRTRSGNGTCR